MLNSIWIGILALIAIIPSCIYRNWIQALPPQSSQMKLTSVNSYSERFWHSAGLKLIQAALKERNDIRDILAAEKKKRNLASELFEPDESELKITGTYDQLPEVYADRPIGAIFPVPYSQPNRVSWYQLCLEARWILRSLSEMRKQIDEWRNLTDLQKAQKFEHLVSRWTEINVKFSSFTQKARYLEAWIPQLKKDPNSPSEIIMHEFFNGDPKILQELRLILRPHRVIQHSFLPSSLEEAPAGVIILPITTDIQNKRFIKEVEGAMDTFWTQSYWAKTHGVGFYIDWKYIKKNTAFADGRETLNQHLSHFPKNRAILTTGGLTTHVKGNALVLGPGKTHPRTLAHELGHLLGFNDCYLRTLSGQGVFGLGVLEWDNPFYPDDIMCDNTVGEAISEVW